LSGLQLGDEWFLQPNAHLEICKQEVPMSPSLLLMDEDLGSLHFLLTIFNFFLSYAWVLSKSKLIAL
jgi:hypothetical protein